MKAKIVLLDNDIIISVNFKDAVSLKNPDFNIRFESEEVLDEIIRKRKNAQVFTDIDFLNLPEKIVELIQNNVPVKKKSFGRKVQPLYGLSAREKEILDLLIKGLTKREMAERLNLSFHTIDSHLRNIYKKMGVNSKSQAISKAYNDGML